MSTEPITRRTIDEYIKEMDAHRRIRPYLPNVLIINSGHKGPHSGIWGTINDLTSYTVDINPDFDPDLVADQFELDWDNYFPDNFFDIVAIDDIRDWCVKSKESILIFRTLAKKIKTDGELVYQPVRGMDCTSIIFSNHIINPETKLDKYGNPSLQLLRHHLVKTSPSLKNNRYDEAYLIRHKCARGAEEDIVHLVKGRLKEEYKKMFSLEERIEIPLDRLTGLIEIPDPDRQKYLKYKKKYLDLKNVVLLNQR
jgi:hypothetical protein